MRVTDLTVEEITLLLAALPTLPRAEQEQLLMDLEELERKKKIAAAKIDFLAYCHYVYPGFKEGPHHRHMKPLLHELRDGTKSRLTVSMPPRFGKSETIAYLFVSWYLGHNPSHQIMMVTHTADLSADFGRKVRNMLDSDIYHEIFPDTVVARDKSAASNWSTTLGGKYLAIGIGANVAGHGAHLLIGDDLCIAQGTAVHTLDGIKKASDVSVGDWLLGEQGYQQVIRKTHSTHAQGVCVGGVTMSLAHPVWTFNRGWVRAGALLSTDVLRTTSVSDKIKSSLRRLYAKRIGQQTTQTVPTGVQHLGTNEAAVLQPESGKLWALWGKGRDGIARVRAVCGLYTGTWSLPESSAHAGQDRQQQGLFCGQLPLGGRGDTAEQSHKRGSFRARWATTVGSAAGAQSGYPHSTDGTPAKKDGVDARTSAGFTEAELGAAPRTAEAFGWLRSAAARVIGRSCKVRTGTGVDTYPSVGESEGQGAASAEHGRVQKALVQLHAAKEAALGVLLGVRRAGYIAHLNTTGTPFVNFEVAGDNTFFAGGILTHNCSEQAVLSSDPNKTFAQAWEYMQVGPLQRLMPNGRIVMIGTRWGTRDPIGRALAWAANNPDSTPWHEVRFPALMPSGKSLWPEQWPLEQLLAKKAGMFPQFWAAQYMQEPTSEEGALIKREWWKVWPKDKPPPCDIVLHSWDTAHETKTASDPSGVQCWGIFYNENTERDELILLDAWTGRKTFPDLKKFALEYYQEWEPDMVLIEKKAAGAPLIQELRAIGVPVQEYTPSRGADKRVRINSVADIFSSGMVWRPDTRWAQEVVDEIASFPNSEHDEHVDCCSQALMRFRQGGLIRLESDAWKDEKNFRPPKREYY